MDWRVVAGGIALGVVLFFVAAYQVLDGIWPLTPALSRSDEEIATRWAELEARVGDDVKAEAASDVLVRIMGAVASLEDEEPVPIEVSAELAAVLDAGASVPRYGCTELPLQVDPARFVSPFDWLPATEGLVTIGRPDLALQVADELREGQGFIPFSIGMGIHLRTLADVPEVVAEPPTSSELLDSVLHDAHCADAMMGAFAWDDAEDFFGQGRVPPRWWYDPAADRNALRDYYIELLDTLEPHRGDPVAMARALDTFAATPHPSHEGLASRLLTLGHAERLGELLDAIQQAAEIARPAAP